MTRVEDVVEINSPTWTVWRVLTDATYLPKLYPDVITVESTPPGRLGMGSQVHVIARLGKVRVDIFVEVTKLENEASFVTRQKPGGLFDSFQQTVTLQPNGMTTMVKSYFDYTLMKEYAETITQEAFLDSRVADNLKWYTRNLKEICELLPLPS